ncbi:N-terminal domain of tricorn protease-containing protein [Novosphingobium sp. CF614]|uniref:S41 family peptidase n=1 Tax=Novosphingobium sp. CF614 TaxID=1884364 RepID=UPI0008E8F2C1|nr:S41 family peptidase [Novosphingobium sp. CF614]SFG35945.1 N-terminal domain of tricorn protease-containing protein [Novosphingobium sp. CF614]
MRKRAWFFSCIIGFLALARASAQPGDLPRPMLSQPSLSPDGKVIAFISGGDIWEVPAEGGTARLLLSDPATEAQPLYSPDGRKIAFTSTRGGNPNIHVLDLQSRKITRITWAEADEELDGWSADGRWIYFSSTAGETGRPTDIFRVSASGGTPMPVSDEVYLPEYQGAPAPDGRSMLLVARGISSTQWWRNGHSHIDQSEIWLETTDGAKSYRKLLAQGAKNAWPAWLPDGRDFIFMSDAGGVENLWRMDAAPGAQPRQLTRFTNGRLLFPRLSMDGKTALFERDMAVWKLDLATNAATPVPISLRGAPAQVGVRHEVLSNYSSLALSPDGKKLALIGHGEIFVAPATDGGPAKRLTHSPGAEDGVVWSPDSRHLLYVTPRGLDVLLAEADAITGEEVLLTHEGIASSPAYAPDGRSASYVLDEKELHVTSLPHQGRAPASRKLYAGPLGTGFGGPAPVWSPDSQHIAFPVVDARSFTNVFIAPAGGGPARQASFLANGEMGQITWAPDGRYILFDSAQRTENSRIFRIDLLPQLPRFREDKLAELFASEIPLDDDANQETAKNKGQPDRSPSPSAQAKSAPRDVRIDWNGIRLRANSLPIGLDADAPLISQDGKTLVFRAREAGRQNFYSYSLDELAKDRPVPVQITSTDRQKNAFGLSPDGKILFYLDGGVPIATPVATPDAKPITITAEMDIDFAAERQAVFDEAWLTLDRHLFDPNFGGKDWTALRQRFQPYVSAAATPDDLRRIIGLMIGELNISHSGIASPERGYGSVPRGRVGDLGLRFDPAAHASGKGLVISAIVPLGPAALQDRIRVGDRLVSIDGVALNEHSNIDALLEYKVGSQVMLGISAPSGRRSLPVRPISAATAAGLRYREWVEQRRALVDRLSSGTLGYVHMYNMWDDALPQLYLDMDSDNQAKQGIVFDIRNNLGGFANGYALDMLERRNYLMMTPRGLFAMPARQRLGQRALGLPTVLVTNEASLSDAEDFTEGYRRLKLGKVVGQPTAGWIIFTSNVTLVDGSVLRVPHTRIQDVEGNDMEMAPRPVDITVEQPVGESLSGGDAQLEAAVNQLRRQQAD